MNREMSYFRIGSFVISGVAILVIGLIVFGSGKIFQKKIYIETYFNESVQGLSVGSPVKYRGLDIGSVNKISFVNQIYQEHKSMNGKIYSRYIYVQVAVTANLLTRTTRQELNEALKNEITQGLRFRLALQGLTGNAYLELNYVNPKTNLPPPIDWTPKGLYIPSTTSTLTKASDNISFILDELQQANLKKLFHSLQNLTDTTNNTMNKLNKILTHSDQQVIDAAGNLRGLSEKLRNAPSSLLFGGPPPRINPGDL